VKESGRTLKQCCDDYECCNIVASGDGEEYENEREEKERGE
jgi:hypothetical protein